MTEANSINAATTGIVGNTGTAFTGTAVTQYNVIVGGSTSSTLSNVAPSATSGVPLVSGGSSANPSFTTAVVAGGGTGIATTTAYAPICGGTTATGAFQAADTGLSTSGFVLTSNGSSSLPSFQAASGVTGPGSSTDRAIATWNGTGGTALFDNSTAKIDSTGRMTNSAQPAFLAYLGTTDTNVTGDGTTFQLGSGNALTEIFDRGSNFNTNGTFTAPVTGVYFLQFAAYIQGATAITSINFQIQTSNRLYRTDMLQPAPALTTTYPMMMSTLADMDASDTAVFNITSVDSGGKVDSIFGAANMFTWVSGYLVC